MIGSGTIGVDAVIRDLLAFEGDESLHFATCSAWEAFEIFHHLDIVRGQRLFGNIIEKLADADIEFRQDFEKGVEADPILALLHARQIRLLNVDARGQIRLGELALFPQLTNLGANKLYLTNLVNEDHVLLA